MIDLKISGGDALVARLESMPDAVRSSLGSAFTAVADALYARVMEELDGEVVQTRSGRLRGAIDQYADEASAGVTLDTDAAPYGAALEFGASIPAQLIAAKNARALAFVVVGQPVFAKRVLHPAFTLPAHSFLRAALDDLAPDVLQQLDDAIAEAIAP